MSNEPVNVYLVDNTLAASPIAGVVVKVFSQNGATVIGQQITDGTGLAAFLLPSGVTYQLRFYKQQVNVKNPQYITVLAAPATNNFTVVGELFSPPVSTDPRLCMCYGFFRTIYGGPAQNLDCHFIAQFKPLLLEGAGVLTERAIERTDANGYMQIPLIRNGQYLVTIQGFEDVQRVISVPDALNANLPDLLFPVVGTVVFNPVGPFVVAVGADVVTTPTVMATDGQILEGVAGSDVQWSVDDPTIAAVIPSATTLTLRGLSSGTTNLRATRLNTSIVRYPDPGILGVPVVITVP